MQNGGIAALKLDWRYLAFDVQLDRLRSAIDGAKAMKFIGVNLTVPHKLLALEIVDVLEETAKSWGAVNTIRFEARDRTGTWMPLHHLPPESIGHVRSHGFNTDADAIARSLREDLGFEARGMKVLLLGAGGAGRVAALKIASERVSQLFLVNRTEDKARRLAEEIRKRFPEVDVNLGYPKTGADLILNATTLGLKSGDPLPLDKTHCPLRNVGYVYDMIYRPAETPLLRLAKKAGCKTANGIGMLLYQGAASLELWSGHKAPITAMRKALEKNVYG